MYQDSYLAVPVFNLDLLVGEHPNPDPTHECFPPFTKKTQISDQLINYNFIIDINTLNIRTKYYTI